MQIALVIYPDINPINVHTRICPRVGESVFYQSKKYIVNNVIHNFDDRVIKVMCADF